MEVDVGSTRWHVWMKAAIFRSTKFVFDFLCERGGEGVVKLQGVLEIISNFQTALILNEILRGELNFRQRQQWTRSHT